MISSKFQSLTFLQGRYISESFEDIEIIPRPRNEQLKHVIVPKDFDNETFPSIKMHCFNLSNHLGENGFAGKNIINVILVDFRLLSFIQLILFVHIEINELISFSFNHIYCDKMYGIRNRVLVSFHKRKVVQNKNRSNVEMF